MSVGTRKSWQMTPLEAIYEAIRPFISASLSVWTVDMSLKISDDPTNDKLCFLDPRPPGLLLCQPPGLPKAQTGTASPTILVWENLIHLRVSNSVCRLQHKGGPPAQPSLLNISPDPRSYLCVHLSYASPRALPQTSPLPGLGPPSVSRLCARVGCTHIEYQCSEMGPENI